MQIDEYSAIQLIRYVQMSLWCIFVSQYCIIQDRNRLRNEFIGLKLNDIIIKEREKLEQKNGGMDASDLQVGLISSHNTAFYTPRNITFLGLSIVYISKWLIVSGSTWCVWWAAWKWWITSTFRLRWSRGWPQLSPRRF